VKMMNCVWLTPKIAGMESTANSTSVDSIITSTAIFASTAPAQPSMNLLRMPSPMAAYTVPASWPTPPITTTMKLSTM